MTLCCPSGLSACTYWPSKSMYSGKSMYFGSHVFIGRGACIAASAGFYVGNHVLIGPEFCVMGGDHDFREVGKVMWNVTTGGTNLPVVVEDDMWIGARVTLPKGARIGRGPVLGAGSVVTTSVPAWKSLRCIWREWGATPRFREALCKAAKVALRPLLRPATRARRSCSRDAHA